MRLGLERPDRWEPLIRGRRVALLSHLAAVDRHGRMALDYLRVEDGWRLVALWGAEHGFWGIFQDMETVGDAPDPWVGRPVYSLYREGRLRPPVDLLRDVDAVVFDMQDVGSRYYTFISTLAHVLDAVAGTDCRVVVLDRPNPLGGMVVEGPVLEPAYRSFVGPHAVPVRHGLTVGEFARLYGTERGLSVDLHVVPLQGWRRRFLWPDTGRRWVNPSPNMPQWTAALVYPGMCLLEGTNVSEGRGTTRPFEQFGAPWVHPVELAESLNALGLPGVRFQPTAFRPQFHKYAGQVCGGVFVHVTDVRRFRPFRTGVAVVATLRWMYPETFRWRTEPYEFVADRLAFDLLCGTSAIRETIEALPDVPGRPSGNRPSAAQKAAPTSSVPSPRRGEGRRGGTASRPSIEAGSADPFALLWTLLDRYDRQARRWQSRSRAFWLYSP